MTISAGVVHNLPDDLKSVLKSDADMLAGLQAPLVDHSLN